MTTSIELNVNIPNNHTSLCDDLKPKSKPTVFLKSIYSQLIVIFTPLILALMFCYVPATNDMKCLYAVLIMIIYWVSEALPLAITALLPLVLYPMLGIVSGKVIASSYLKDSLFLFAGGYFIAIALEKCMLHKRIALKTLLIVGSDSRKILLALMACTAFLSLWISNGAVTGMMLPIIDAILVEMIKGMRSDEKNKQKSLENHIDNHLPAENNDVIKLSPESLQPEELNLCKMMYLAACYASSIGGTGTLTGTPPNVIIYGFVEQRYGSETGLSYISWILYALPQVLLTSIAAWIILMFCFLGFKKTLFASETKGDVVKVVQRQYDNLGPLSYQEKNVATIFGILVFLWITHSPKFMPGWSDFFEPGYVTNATPAILFGCILFILPAEPISHISEKNVCKPKATLMDWKFLQAKFPWGMLLLVGGSFAMAQGIELSGLSKLIGDNLAKLSFLSPTQLCIVATLLASFITEFTTNAAAGTILAPVLFAVAEKIGMNPLYLIMPAAIGISYAFMLPSGTAPNAVIFSLGVLKVTDMVKVGFILNIFTALVTILATNTYGYYLFDLGTFPAWAQLIGKNDLNLTTDSLIFSETATQLLIGNITLH